jgi:hypothetical protein
MIATNAFAWDPVGDLLDPGRILRNAEREARAALAAADLARREAMIQAGYPLLQAWLEQSSRDASNGAQPIPAHIREQLEYCYSRAELDGIKFKVGDPGVFNLSNLSISYGGAFAVTLGDVIVFKTEHDAQTNALLWSHEVHHAVKQFRPWGFRDFSIRYLRSWNSVEDEAYRAQDECARKLRSKPIYVDLDGNGQLDKVLFKTNTIVTHLNGSNTEKATFINPNYDVADGFWLAIDVNPGEKKCVDLVHMVPGRGLAHTHVSQCNGQFEVPDEFYFNRHGVANEQNDYNSTLGYWDVTVCGGRQTLRHNPLLPDGRKHFWYPREQDDPVVVQRHEHSRRFGITHLCPQ